MKERTKKIILLVASVLVIFIGVTFVYLSDSYSPTSDAMLAMTSTERVEVQSHGPRTIC